ncbi:hypothetical protein SPB21_13390 [Leptothoe sp. ISB3NOV94-8A]|nr:hypothetical protein [Leptothoe sp. LEGE 181152]
MELDLPERDMNFGDAALLPGEVRPIHVIEELANAYKRYEVKVVEAE